MSQLTDFQTQYRDNPHVRIIPGRNGGGSTAYIGADGSLGSVAVKFDSAGNAQTVTIPRNVTSGEITYNASGELMGAIGKTLKASADSTKPGYFANALAREVGKIQTNMSNMSMIAKLGNMAQRDGGSADDISFMGKTMEAIHSGASRLGGVAKAGGNLAKGLFGTAFSLAEAADMPLNAAANTLDAARWKADWHKKGEEAGLSPEQLKHYDSALDSYNSDSLRSKIGGVQTGEHYQDSIAGFEQLKQDGVPADKLKALDPSGGMISSGMAPDQSASLEGYTGRHAGSHRSKLQAPVADTTAVAALDKPKAKPDAAAVRRGSSTSPMMA